MLLAALLDAGADAGRVQRAVDQVLPGRFLLRTEAVRRAGLRASLLVGEERDPTHRSGGAGAARLASDLLSAVESSPLDTAVRETAASILRKIGEGEARVHGVSVEDVRLHELALSPPP
jgi:uncharacterized protein (DUF111 family)